MIYNIRGTSGSGKTHLVRRLVQTYAEGEPITADGKIFGYRLFGDRLRVLGRYDDAIKGGGVDNITSALHKRYLASGRAVGKNGKPPNSMDAVEAQVRRWASAGRSVIFEGLIVTSIWGRWVEMAHDLPVHFLFLDTPLETCQQRVQERNGGKPLTSNSLEDKHQRNLVHCRYAQQDGLLHTLLHYETAYEEFLPILRSDGLIS